MAPPPLLERVMGNIAEMKKAREPMMRCAMEEKAEDCGCRMSAIWRATS